MLGTTAIIGVTFKIMFVIKYWQPCTFTNCLSPSEVEHCVDVEVVKHTVQLIIVGNISWNNKVGDEMILSSKPLLKWKILFIRSLCYIKHIED